MLTIVFCWITLFLLISLIGRLFIKEAFWFEYFWIGLVFVFAFLQVWSIFLPTNYIAFVILAFLAGISFYVDKKKFKIPKLNFKFIVVASFVLLIISYYASQSVGWDDTLLYHLNAVKWGKLYAVVPGLANLHSRLGFNSSFFLFASLLDNLFMSDRSSHLALSLLTAVLSIQYLWIFNSSLKRELKLFCLLTLPLIVYSVAFRQIIASLSPDFAMLILTLALCVQFLLNSKKSSMIALLLATTLITVKFSAIAFVGLMILFLIFKYPELIKRVVVWGPFIMVPYLIRNYYLSGWLFYPLPFFKINTDWTVPEGSVKGLYTVIKTWARVPGSEWTKFIDAPFSTWFPVWFQNNRNSFEFKLLVASLIISVFIKIFITTNKINVNLLKLWVISFASIFYVFFTAPDFRFGEVFIWINFAITVAILITQIGWNKYVKDVLIIFVLLLTIYIAWPPRYDTKPILRSVRWDQAWPTEVKNGIHYPLEQELCGNSDLPCTPEKNNIKWRVQGDLSRGFFSNAN